MAKSVKSCWLLVMWRRQRGLCHYCKTRTVVLSGLSSYVLNWKAGTVATKFGVFRVATTEHLIPRCHGGRSTSKNLVMACLPCNRDRGKIAQASIAALRKSRRAQSSEVNLK